MYARFVALRIRPAGCGIREAADGPDLPVRWLLAKPPATQPEPVQSDSPSALSSASPVSKRGGAGLNPYQVARELQLLLTVWTGAHPTWHGDMPEPISTWPKNDMCRS
ncbi:hypothetical protein [Streptomyces achromogenes]|uniref:hypothetical protein n=1 Tax=Streptomyces achromogenes TaxID=67255 RepID=UPI001FD77EB9|nr:hypothetical protein [Streptomyces achromogenes]